MFKTISQVPVAIGIYQIKTNFCRFHVAGDKDKSCNNDFLKYGIFFQLLLAVKLFQTKALFLYVQGGPRNNVFFELVVILSMVNRKLV